jgi:hypothetical protein
VVTTTENSNGFHLAFSAAKYECERVIEIEKEIKRVGW